MRHSRRMQRAEPAHMPLMVPCRRVSRYATAMMLSSPAPCHMPRAPTDMFTALLCLMPLVADTYAMPYMPFATCLPPVDMQPCFLPVMLPAPRYACHAARYTVPCVTLHVHVYRTFINLLFQLMALRRSMLPRRGSVARSASHAIIPCSRYLIRASACFTPIAPMPVDLLVCHARARRLMARYRLPSGKAPSQAARTRGSKS